MVEGVKVFEGIPIVESRGTIPSAFSALSCDSRRLRPGDLFVALRGETFDGHDFLRAAAERNAGAAVVEQLGDLPSLPQIRVRDTLATLPRLAANFYNRPADKLSLIGVTGSNGKTTSTYLLESIWKAAEEDIAIVGTIEYRYGNQRMEASNTTPLPHEMQQLLHDIVLAGHRRVVMEVSSHGIALHRIDEMEFETALFTNLSPEHLDFHKTMEQYRDTKKRLFTEYLRADGTAVMNIDDPVGRQFVQELTGTNVVTYGLEREADLTAHAIEVHATGNRFTIIFPDKSQAPVQSPLVGRHNIYNILGAVSVAWAYNISINVIQQGIEQFTAVPGRLEPVPNTRGKRIFVDYCHTPDALEKCLLALRELPHRHIVTLFGCGGDRDSSKRPLMGRIALKYSDRVIVTNDNPRTEDPLRIIRGIEEGMREAQGGYEVIPDRKKAIESGIRQMRPDDIFLIAGKGHETYQIIGREKYPFDDRKVARDILFEEGQGASLWL
ncbi:UDP-N-acetylmuramoyl-L-alanyl-D-glutamate--2,6-diaminopimelate ligase [bacterium]|nr:UDP-N-acetylmuramoyl-L-alanyl-D-glutamate--2,6-diaminopimelate ligase [bacterium]